MNIFLSSFVTVDMMLHVLIYHNTILISCILLSNVLVHLLLNLDQLMSFYIRYLVAILLNLKWFNCT